MIGGLIGSVSAAAVIIVAIVLYAIGETEKAEALPSLSMNDRSPAVQHSPTSCRRPAEFANREGECRPARRGFSPFCRHGRLHGSSRRDELIS